MPDTYAAFISFLLLVAPGALWETLRARRQPRTDRSTFREITAVVLASAAFSITAIVAVVAAARWQWPRSLDRLTEFLIHGADKSNVSPIFAGHFLVAEAAVALALVLTADRVVGERLYGTPSLREESIWVALFRTAKPEGTEAVATVWLSDGSRLRGHVAYFSVDEEIDKREIGLAWPINHFPTEGAARAVESQFIVVPASEIRAVEVAYVSVEALETVRRDARRGLGLTE